jgi:hypothetical protein
MTRTEVIDSIFTMTFYNRRKELIDCIFKSTPFFKWLTGKEKIGEKPGGLGLEIPVQLGKNTTTQTIGRGETIGISDTDFARLAKYDWKTVATSVVRYHDDDIRNSQSDTQIINYVNGKIDNARNSLIENIEEILTVFEGLAKSPEALNTLISATPTTGVLAGIDRAVYTGWQNKVKAASGAATTYLLGDMVNLYNTCSLGVGGPPDYILTTQAVAELYEAEFMERRTVSQADTDLGHTGLEFKGVPIAWSEFVPDGLMYMLNSQWIEICVSDTAAMEMTSWKEPVNQVNDRVAQIVVTLQLITTNPRKLGVLTGIA